MQINNLFFYVQLLEIKLLEITSLNRLFLYVFHQKNKSVQKKLLLCFTMDSFDQTDIDLLFKSIVILPQDSSKKVDATKAGKKPKKYETQSIENKVEEPEVKPSNPVKTIAIITNSELKENYLTQGSSFLKILEALEISSAKNKLITDVHLDDLINYTCIWCVGLDPEIESKILKINHPNILLSPNILDLKTKEEKIAMYGPLKAFVTQNFSLFTSK